MASKFPYSGSMLGKIGSVKSRLIPGVRKEDGYLSNNLVFRQANGLAPYGSSVDPDAAIWATAVVANGGTYSAATLTAVSDFCVSAKASGYWSKLNRLNLFCGDQLAAALVPLKIGGGSSVDTNVNFVSGDYTEATGLTGNGTTKYLNTGLNSSALTANSTHLAVYNRGSTSNGGVTLGVQDAGTNLFELYAPFSDSKFYSDQYGNVGGRVGTAAAISTPYGFLVGSRVSAVDHQVYRNATSLATAATSQGSLIALPIFVFALNNNGISQQQNSATLSAYSIGDGLTSSDVTAYNTHMQAFQTALSRSV